MKLPVKRRADLHIFPRGDQWGFKNLCSSNPTIFLSQQLRQIYSQSLVKSSAKDIAISLANQDKPPETSTVELALEKFDRLQFYEGLASSQERQLYLSSKMRGGELYLPERFADRHSIDKFLEHYLTHSKSEPRHIEGMLLPHVSNKLSHNAYAETLSYLNKDNWPDLFIICGTSHYVESPSLFSHNVIGFHDTIYTHQATINYLLEKHNHNITVNDPIFVVEHSWQTPLPYLEALAHLWSKELQIVPLLMGTLSFKEGIQLGKTLSEIAWNQKLKVSVIASGDLSHFGHGYQWKPQFLKMSKRHVVSDVSRSIENYEAPILESICDLDHGKTESNLKESSFCAKSQLGTLLGFVSQKGDIITHDLFYNFAETKPLTSNNFWRPSDIIVSTASLIFCYPKRELKIIAHDQSTQQNLVKLCPRILFHRTNTKIMIFHQCDHTCLSLNIELQDILGLLICGELLNEQFTERCSFLVGQSFDQDDIRMLIQTLKQYQLIHSPFDPSKAPMNTKQKTYSTIKEARTHVPFYKNRLRSNNIESIPLLFKQDVIAHWNNFQSTHFDKQFIENSELVRRRLSSGSTNKKPLLSIIETTVDKERRLGYRKINPIFFKRPSSINRLANFIGSTACEQVPYVKFTDNDLTISPGHNPTDLSPEVLDECINKLLYHQPDFIHGDPAYLSELGRRIQFHGLHIKSIKTVDCGHSHLWSPYRRIIENAFKARLSIRYHSSELGDMAVTCPKGFLHLIEDCTYYEIIKGTKDVSIGETGLLVATTLDTKLRPLIRYVTGDLVELIGAGCSCGKPFRRIKYQGRAHQLIQKSNGSLITYDHIDQLLSLRPEIRHFQLLIDDHSAVMSIVESVNIDKQHLKQFKSDLSNLLDKPVKIRHVKKLRVKHMQKLQTILVNNTLETKYIKQEPSYSENKQHRSDQLTTNN
ncbi:MAG: AmmeMemoRadiSam system protein B [Bdellovibrionales bacterium]|nr:AmmeMemoRadiSam system protein B [Bdellovibrionales bacterium]